MSDVIDDCKERPGDIVVPKAELLIGDVLVGGYVYGGTFRYAFKCSVTVDAWLDSNSIRFKRDDGTRYIRPLSDISKNFIIRARKPATNTKTPSSEYPHACTRCGQAAYMGFNGVDHRDEAAASSCPARRL